MILTIKRKVFAINALLGGVAMLLFFSCKKQNSTSSASTTFIKTITTSGNMFALNGFLLSDGNYLVAGSSLGGTIPGVMVKMDINGNLLWQKTMPLIVSQLYKAMPLSTGGFLVIGIYENSTDYNLNIIRYDNDGNEDSVITIYPPGTGNPQFPIDMIQLSNGNFAICGSVFDLNNSGIPFLIITDKSFNVLYEKEYAPLTGEPDYGITGMCETPDGLINIAGTIVPRTYNPFLLKCYYNAVQESFTYINDTNAFETPSVIGMTGNGQVVMIDSRANLRADSGSVVNYFYNTSIGFIAGNIVIKTPGNKYNFNQLATISGYPNNGIVHSCKPTSDGGSILCGTVNQGSTQNAATTNTELYVAKLNANFGIQWANNYLTNYASIGADACQAADGGYFICGSQSAFGNNYNMVIIKTDASGNIH